MEKMIQQIIQILQQKHLTLASCESFTGGMFANEITNIPGASCVFLGGYVAYSPNFKQQIGVDKRVIKKYGLVSQEVSEAMALATTKKTKANLVVSFTGNAGPSAQDNGEAGLAYFSFNYLGSLNTFKIYQPNFQRKDFKAHVLNRALSVILDRIQK